MLLRWSESLSAIARTGLGFTESLYERERFEEVLRVAADIRAAANEGFDGVEDAEGLVEEWLGQVVAGIGDRHFGRGFAHVLSVRDVRTGVAETC